MMGSAPSQEKKGSFTVIPVNAKPENRRLSLAPLAADAKPDVMISYSHADSDQMIALRDTLTKNGFVVWVDVVGLQAGVNFFDKIGTAIINARLFITLLSESAIASKYCRDEISLAYVLDKPLFPVFIQEKEKLEKCMDIGMRLEFSNLTWYDYSNSDTLLEDMNAAKLEAIKAENITKTARNPAKPLKRAQTRSKLRSKSFTEKGDDFWDNYFPKDQSLDPNVFMDKLTPMMSEKLSHLIKGDVDKRYVSRIVRRKLVKHGVIDKKTYLDFCQDETGLKMDFFSRIEEYTVERYAITQVFQVDSSVRLQAIENLGKYRSTAVIEALTEVLDDSDSDARAVAAITLAKTGITNQIIKRRLLALVEDEDRLVRESACLALGHLRVEEAVPVLVKIWRTEVMSSVRDAAEMALKKVGGREAEEALHMVGVLSKEIQFLISN